MSATVRAAVVGLSWIGADAAGAASDPVLGTAAPYSHASALAVQPAVTLTAGCDLSPQAREAFAQRWPGVRTYPDVHQLLADQPPDLLCVATPDHLHAEVVLAAIRAGVRMIFCEKPLATDLATADHLVATARRTGTTMSVNYTRRWLPDVVEARAQVRAGAIGPLAHVLVQTGGPRAMLFRNLTHGLDLLSYFADAEPEWVIAELEPADYGTDYRGDGGHDPATEPGANVYVAFRNGVRGYLAGMKSAPPGEATQLAGAGGRIVLDAEGARLILAAPEAPLVRRLTPRATVAGMAAAVADLVASHRAGRPTASPPEQARHAVALTAAILASQAQGNARVPVPPPDPKD